jgi:hypothetical protein
VYLLGVGLALVALALAFTDWVMMAPSAPGVTEANVRHIRPGMTVEQVEALLGGPGQPITLLDGSPSRQGSLWQPDSGAAIIEITTTGILVQSRQRVLQVRWELLSAHPLARLRARLS